VVLNAFTTLRFWQQPCDLLRGARSLICDESVRLGVQRIADLHGGAPGKRSPVALGHFAGDCVLQRQDYDLVFDLGL
jgi:hypothetical protein